MDLHCMICNDSIDETKVDNWCYCPKCLADENPEKMGITQSLDQFLKELNGLFYHDVGECECVHPEERKLFWERWMHVYK